MSKITNYYKPSYSIMTAIAMKLNIISVKESMKSHTLKQKLITDYYKKSNIYFTFCYDYYKKHIMINISFEKKII